MVFQEIVAILFVVAMPNSAHNFLKIRKFSLVQVASLDINSCRETLVIPDGTHSDVT